MFQVKGLYIALLQATDEFLIFRAVVEVKDFGFSCVVLDQQYSLNFILVSYFHFEMFGIMADICCLAFAICVFSLLHSCFLAFAICVFVSPYLTVFKFAFSNKIINLNLCRNFLINMNVL